MVKTLPFFASYLTAVTMLVGVWLGGWFTFLTPAIVFVGLPLLDAVVGHDPVDTLPEGADGGWFDHVVRLWVPAQLAVLGAVLWFVAYGDPTWVELIGLALSTGLVTAGGAINAAHELMHRKGRFDRALAEILMTTASYTHFCIEHVHGHHKHVATPADPAAARLGQTVYGFVPQSVLGGFASAIRIERVRNARRGVPVGTWRNRLTRYAVVGALSWVAVAAAFGPVGLAFHVVQSALAIGLLEVINYVEHYGLTRAELGPGRYEAVQPKHSWNANHRISNWWLFNLQRHADHHANASRPYWNLRALDDGPQLPFSYPAAILVALVPPLWHALIDPLVASGADRQVLLSRSR